MACAITAHADHNLPCSIFKRASEHNPSLFAPSVSVRSPINPPHKRTKYFADALC